MKIYLILLLLLSGCASDSWDSYLGNAERARIPKVTRYQSCYFEEDMLIKWDDLEYRVKAGDTLDLVDPLKPWGSYEDNGYINGWLQIDTGYVISSDTVTIRTDFEEYYYDDTTYINIYHGGICTVSVSW